LYRVYFKISKKVFGIMLSVLFVFLGLIIVMNDKIEKKLDPILTTSTGIEQIMTKNKYTYTRNTLEHRFYIDYLVISDWKNTFPFGLGTGDTQDYLNHLYRENKFLTGIAAELNAHNQYFQEY